jgi:hypothetical protein
MTVDLKEVKKRITGDWSPHFPGLAPYAPNKLYKLIGPLVAGIELTALPRSENYRPHLVMYPLWGNQWGNDVKACLQAPDVLLEFTNKKGNLLDIAYARHDDLIGEAAAMVKEQLKLSLNGDVSLEELFETVDIRLAHILVKTHAGQQAKLYSFKFHTALYTGNTGLAKTILQQIGELAAGWNTPQFQAFYGDINDWMAALQEKLHNKDQLMITIETNRQDKKLMKLKSSVLLK